MLCALPLAAATPTYSALSVSSCHIRWSSAFVSASILVMHRSLAAVCYQTTWRANNSQRAHTPDAVVASYYEVFWTCRNNINGGLMQKDSGTTMLMEMKIWADVLCKAVVELKMEVMRISNALMRCTLHTHIHFCHTPCFCDMFVTRRAFVTCLSHVTCFSHAMLV